MFDSLTIKQTYSKPLNIGQLLEALIFYNKVELVLDSYSLKTIFKDISLLSFLFSLVKEKKLTIHFVNGPYAISSVANEGMLVCILDSKGKLPGPVIETLPYISDTLHANLILDFWEETKHYKNIADGQSIKSDIKSDFIFRAAINSVLEYFFPELSNYDDLYLLTDRVYRNDNSDIFNYELVFDEKISSDLRIKDINSLMKSPISAIVDANINIEMSSRFNSDFQSETIYDSLLQTKVNKIFKSNNSKLSSGQKIFQDIIIHDIKSIEVAINENYKTMNDYLELYESSFKFKEWLTKIPNESNVINEYLSEMSKGQWFEKLPVKGLRWSIFTGAGLAIDLLGAGGIGTISGIGISATDAFYLDKILSGWKPNMFIKGKLNEFLSRND